jgi:thiol-disulfide isomerase/thioredoxin
LLAVVLALAGCKSTDTKPTDKEPSGTAASRARNKDGTPKWLDPVAGLPGADTTVPKGGNWSGNPTNAKADAQDAVGGKVVDSFGRPAKNVFVRVEAVNGPPGAAAMGIYTDGGGYFFTRGLKPGKAYNLTAEATQEGKQFTGSVQTQVPNPVITLVLREDLGLPPGAKSTETPTGGAFPPPPDSDRIPPMALGPAAIPNTPRPKPTDASFAPGHGATNPVPATIGPAPGVAPAPGAIPQPDDLSNDPKPMRPENVADGVRSPYTAPPASIPGPPSLPPSYPNPVPPPVGPDRKMGVRVAPGANFTLVDTLERDWDFATDKSGSMVLLEFITTACPNCKPAVPILKDLQSRYGANGLQVIAVLCDDVPRKARAAAAAKYARDNNTNYAVYVVPGSDPNALGDRYGVEGYPTAVLLDATGAVVWKGHPARRAEIENAVRRALGR